MKEAVLDPLQRKRDHRDTNRSSGGTDQSHSCQSERTLTVTQGTLPVELRKKVAVIFVSWTTFDVHLEKQ